MTAPSRPYFSNCLSSCFLRASSVAVIAFASATCAFLVSSIFLPSTEVTWRTSCSELESPPNAVKPYSETMVLS